MGSHKDRGWEWNFIWRRSLFDSEIDLAVNFMREVEGKVIQQQGSDEGEWSADPTGQYSTRNAYQMLEEEAVVGSQEECFVELWKLKIPSRILCQWYLPKGR